MAFRFSSKCLYLLLFFAVISAYAREVDLVAGFRASRVLNSYPNRQFPNEDYWVSVGNRMAAKFNGAAPATVWIVSLYIENGITQFNFPSPGGNYRNIWFIGQDQNEAYLNRFDQEGFKVWLQVEPGSASIDTLMELVLQRYGHHPCVRGFGIDVEWYHTNTHSGGRKVTDAEAADWEARVKAYNADYTLFLKHYGTSWMPPTYRGTIIFIDDSQGFTSFNQIVSEFKTWGSRFSPNPVGFQFGYLADQPIWGQFSDPAATIGQALIDQIPNLYTLYWVDFTVFQVFPPTGIENESIGTPPESAQLKCFPNPSNAQATISYSLYQAGHVRLDLYNILGQKILNLIDRFQSPGDYKIALPATSSGTTSSPSGVYFIKGIIGNQFVTQKITYMR